jgi:hypothetical protein
MHSDIIYEIVQYLHLASEENGGPVLSRKILISEKKFRCLELPLEKIHKPIVFDVCNNLVDLKRMVVVGKAIIYWGDDEITDLSSVLILNQLHTYKDTKLHTIKIFGYITNISLPDQITNLHSIGNLKSMYHMFSVCTYLDKDITKKIDTSAVVDISYAFNKCENLDCKIGKNWNTSNIRGMFMNCTKLNKNIGKNWDMSNITDMAFMFFGCVKLNKNIGKKMGYF